MILIIHRENSDDQARYYGAYIIFWSQVEINTAIVCASAPSLQPLLKSIVGRFVSWRAHNAYYCYGAGSHSMVEAGVSISPRRGRMPPDSISGLELPPSAYDPNKNKRSTYGTDDTLAMQETDEEHELRDRVRHFTSQASSVRSHPLESPKHPRDMITANG